MKPVFSYKELCGLLENRRLSIDEVILINDFFRDDKPKYENWQRDVISAYIRIHNQRLLNANQNNQ